MKQIFFLMIIFNLVACSGAKSGADVSEEDTGIELSDSQEFVDETQDIVADEFASENIELNNQSNGAEDQAPLTIDAGGEQIHTVGKNETLMMVAFNIYGDYAKWKEIASYNNLNSYQLFEGQQLKYLAPAQQFVWNPQGNPYLIKKKDTLGKISDDTYGTTKKWKDIWENNKPLIKDPNKIFVGFTIYTPILESNEVAIR